MFLVHRIDSSDDTDRWNNISISSWSTEHRLEQLNPDHLYGVRIRAQNELGKSDFTNEHEFKTREEGGTPIENQIQFSCAADATCSTVNISLLVGTNISFLY